MDQRAYASGTALAANTYAHDRWRSGANGCTYTFAAALGDNVVTITAGSLQQVLDAGNNEGSVFTLSWSGTAAGTLTYMPAGASSAVMTPAKASPVSIPATAPGTTIVAEFGAGTLGAVQIEAGSTASAFERRFLSTEIFLCQFYYQAGKLRYYTTNNYMGGQYKFPVTMRVSPALSYFDYSGAKDANGQPTPGTTGLISTSNNASPGLSPQYGGVHPYAGYLDVDVVFNVSSCGNWAGFFYTCDAEIY